MDDAADAGATDDSVHTAPVDPAIDHAARDAEFTLFYTNDMPSLVGFLVVQGAHTTAAADLAQEAMTEAYRYWDVIDTPRAWVRTVATRKWWRLARREQTEQPHDELPEPGRLLSVEAAAEIEERHTFLTLLRSLPPAQREVMAWTYDGYGPTEIAALLGKNPATVRSVLRQARATLQLQYPPAEETA